LANKLLAGGWGQTRPWVLGILIYEGLELEGEDWF